MILEHINDISLISPIMVGSLIDSDTKIMMQ